jgi:hypothetical protein
MLRDLNRRAPEMAGLAQEPLDATEAPEDLYSGCPFPFPILPDPRLQLARGYGATNSAFVALISPEGQIDELWPGYSASMLRDARVILAIESGSIS